MTLLRIARRHGADADDAEDAAHEAMLRAAVTASLRVLAWAWRAQISAVSDPAPIALASATVATMMAVTSRLWLEIDERPNELPGPLRRSPQQLWLQRRLAVSS
ncbi:MAG: hypothetical protein ACRDSL_00345 [Pseudonocardiaceae bacterium]